MLHIVIVLNVFQLSAMLPGHEGSFKDHKNAFLNDPKGQKSVKKCQNQGFRSIYGFWLV